MSTEIESKNHNINDHYLVYHNKTLKCICQLCTCGKHHCPRPRVKGNFQTSYSQQYKKPPVANTPSPMQQYKYQQRHYNPETLRTSYKDTYQPYIIQQQSPQSSGSNRFQNIASKMILNRVPFTGSSSYKDQYKPFEIKPINQYPEEGPAAEGEVPAYTYHKSPVKFQGQSSYKANFTPPPKQSMSSSLPPSQIYRQQVYVPFYGETSYKKDFPGYKIQPRKQQNLDMQRIKVPPVKFEGHTSYKDQFQGYKIQMDPQSGQGSRCIVDKLTVPTVNYINDKQHIYYDPEQRKFI